MHCFMQKKEKIKNFVYFFEAAVFKGFIRLTKKKK